MAEEFFEAAAGLLHGSGALPGPGLEVEAADVGHGPFQAFRPRLPGLLQPAEGGLGVAASHLGFSEVHPQRHVIGKDVPAELDPPRGEQSRRPLQAVEARLGVAAGQGQQPAEVEDLPFFDEVRLAPPALPQGLQTLVRHRPTAQGLGGPGSQEEGPELRPMALPFDPGKPRLMEGCGRVAQGQEQLRLEAAGQGPIGSSGERAEPIRRETPKVGRNEPCPCGSGKKYKRCHGAPSAVGVS